MDTRKLNLRLPVDLHAEAVDLAAYMGVSLNGLCMMALRNWIAYQNRNRRPAALQGTTGEATTSVSLVRGRSSAINNFPEPAGGVNQPCPCGSGKKYKRCHGRPG